MTTRGEVRSTPRHVRHQLLAASVASVAVSAMVLVLGGLGSGLLGVSIWDAGWPGRGDDTNPVRLQSPAAPQRAALAAPEPGQPDGAVPRVLPSIHLPQRPSRRRPELRSAPERVEATHRRVVRPRAPRSVQQTPPPAAAPSPPVPVATSPAPAPRSTDTRGAAGNEPRGDGGHRRSAVGTAPERRSTASPSPRRSHPPVGHGRPPAKSAPGRPPAKPAPGRPPAKPAPGRPTSPPAPAGHGKPPWAGRPHQAAKAPTAIPPSAPAPPAAEHAAAHEPPGHRRATPPAPGPRHR